MVAYNALMEGVRLLPIGPELAEALRAGSGPLRQRYGALVAAEDLPLVRDVVEQTLLMPDYDDDGGWGGYLAVDPKRPGRRLVRVQGASYRGRDGRDRLLHVRSVRGTRPRQEHGTGRSSPRRFRRTSYAA